jgi:prevent-host-death family protein
MAIATLKDFNLTTASNARSQFAKISKEVKSTKTPAIVFNNNKPDVVIMDYSQYEKLADMLEVVEDMVFYDEANRRLNKNDFIGANALIEEGLFTENLLEDNPYMDMSDEELFD